MSKMDRSIALLQKKVEELEKRIVELESKSTKSKKIKK